MADYRSWMEYAADCGIRQKWKTAQFAWRRAATLIRAEARQFGKNDFDWYGHPVETLKEIRQRIRWIRSGDHDHALLYRPQDRDLQIPPYTLGRAWSRIVEETP